MGQGAESLQEVEKRGWERGYTRELEPALGKINFAMNKSTQSDNH